MSDDDGSPNLEQAEAIFAAITAGAGRRAVSVAKIYGEVFHEYVIRPSGREAATMDDAKTAALERAYVLVGQSLYITGALVEHIANSEGKTLDEIFGIVRSRLMT